MTDYDISALAADLADDHIAGTDDPQLVGALADALTPHPDAGIALIDAPVGAAAAQLRDVAYDLQQASGLDTVIARSPDAVAIVSNSASRASIEAAQTNFIAQPDYPTAVTNLWGDLGAADGGASWWPWVAIAVLAGMVAVATLAWSSVKR